MRAVTWSALAVLAGLPAAAHAQAPDLSRAKALYVQATQEMAAGKYEDAARDYSAVYDLTKDPVLFFKIGSADENAGHCEDALLYFKRYLDEARPAPQFVQMTKEREDACAAQLPDYSAPVLPGTPAPAPVTVPAPVPAPAPAAVPAAVPAPGSHHVAAWLLVGGSIAFVTTGGVLAYSASSSEQDLEDLYVGIGGVRPTYNSSTARRYHDLIDEGNRYEHLSWAAFGAAAGCAVAAAILFVHGSSDESVTLAPVITPRDAGVSASLRF